MTPAEIALATARGLHFCAVLSVFGTLLAAAIGVATAGRAWCRLLLTSVVAGAVTAPVWLILQAREMAGAATLTEALDAAPIVLRETGFGHALLARLALLGFATLPLWRDTRPVRLTSLIAAGLACLAQLRMGHAAAPDGPWQVPAAALHLLAAASWIGGLVPLALGLGDDPRRVARCFSHLGLVAVASLAATALAQAAPLLGGLPGLLGTAYGHVILIKTALFSLLLGLAAMNRFRLVPRLESATPEAALAALRRSILLETCVGVAAVLAAAVLAGLPPGAHDQPIWPLPWQPSGDALDDPAVVQRLTQAGLLIMAAAAIALAGTMAKPHRALMWVASGLAAVPAILSAAPMAARFLAPATPASFFESPTGFTKASVARGSIVYRRSCAACHGASGFGDGPRASFSLRRPAPLTGFHLLARTDGDMFWLVSAGIPSPTLATMPGFASTLSEDDRWAVIDYVRTLAGAEPGEALLPAHHH